MTGAKQSSCSHFTLCFKNQEFYVSPEFKYLRKKNVLGKVNFSFIKEAKKKKKLNLLLKREDQNLVSKF